VETQLVAAPFLYYKDDEFIKKLLDFVIFFNFITKQALSALKLWV
jgi:hypothetical protein